MTATCTFDVSSGLDGHGAAGGDWTGSWGRQGPELLESRTLDGHVQELVHRPGLHRGHRHHPAAGPHRGAARPATPGTRGR